jgi:alanyl-tRNA synthetase
MQSQEIREKFLTFFKERGHAIIPSASLVPENDPTVLFTTAGMQPLVPYLMGEPHPLGDKLADIQKCLRTGDIDDIGDNTHLTFFEMMGNWSLGSYFKEEAIKWSYELLTNPEVGFGLDPKRLYVTVFAGDENAPRDEEAARVWQAVGVPAHRIYYKGADANWWPAVKGKDTWTGPTGPCSEMFYDLTETGLGDLTPEAEQQAEDDQRLVEIWNDVFMEYEKKDGRIISKLAKRNVDTGAGLERLATVLQNKKSVFETDIFAPVIAKIKESATQYDEKAARIVADHLRAATFLIADGVVPSNKDQGYVLRRIIRRAVFKMGYLGLQSQVGSEIMKMYIDKYAPSYPNLKEKDIIQIFREEEERFTKTLQEGQREFERGTDPFTLWTSYGFPIELTEELAKAKGVTIDKEAFEAEFKKHQDLSRAGAEQKFKGGLGDTSEMSVKYHTATHLLHQALHDVLGEEVGQKGSNITPERLRFDFSFPRKLTDEEKQQVEQIVNEKIALGLPVNKVIMPKAEAEQTGARHFFGEKYPDEVSVYYIGDSLESAYSKEFCGGPHVESLVGLGTFKIAKEEAVSAGVRRIKAVLE